VTGLFTLVVYCYVFAACSEKRVNMRVYYNEWSPYCHKLLYFLEEASLPCERVHVDFATFDFNAPDFLAVSPGAQIPAIETEFGSVAESTVCMRYLSDRFHLDHLYPRNLEDRAVVDFWTEYINQHVSRYIMSLSWQRFFMPRRGLPVDQKSVADSLSALEKYLPPVNRHLLGRSYFAGSGITIADINFMGFMFQSGPAALNLRDYPAIEAWYERMRARPAWRRLLKEIR
jgi:glutathione S-transferase